MNPIALFVCLIVFKFACLGGAAYFYLRARKVDGGTQQAGTEAGEEGEGSRRSLVDYSMPTGGYITPSDSNAILSNDHYDAQIDVGSSDAWTRD